MQMIDLGRLAIAACLVLGAGCTANVANSDSGVAPIEAIEKPTEKTTEVAADPCAGADPCAAATPEATDPEATSPEAAPSETVAQTETTSLQFFADDRGLAIRGTDPVAYFTDGAPVAGRAEFTHTWGNATWRFASAENRDRFAADPEQYAPQYGGFCAWAVSQGYTASIDPNAWRIVDGRLYLNYSRGVQRRWERDIPGHISQADRNWPGVLN